MKKSPRMSKDNIAKKSQHTEWIKQIHSPSPVKMVKGVYGGQAGFTEKMGPEIEGLFQKYFGQQIELVLKKRKKVKKGGA